MRTITNVGLWMTLSAVEVEVDGSEEGAEPVERALSAGLPEQRIVES